MITRLPLVLSIFIFLGAILFTVCLSNIKHAAQKKKHLILYLITGGILVGITGTLGFIEFSKLSLFVFMGAMIWMLIIGIIHSRLFGTFFGIDVKGKILFTLAIFFFGYSLIFLFYKFVIKVPFPWIFLSPGFCFLTPAFIVTAFGRFTDIPVRVFKAWSFPQPGTLSDPNDSEMADPVIINFEIRKKINDNRTVFKAKAPKGMTLGRLFYYFVMDYNSRYPHNPVLINEGENSYFKWSFLISRSIFSGKTYPDPDLSISDNKIKENSSITCERVTS
ncbi:MAG: TssN family type VI secretion system protein [Bacteroidales bacterium]